MVTLDYSLCLRFWLASALFVSAASVSSCSQREVWVLAAHHCQLNQSAERTKGEHSISLKGLKAVIQVETMHVIILTMSGGGRFRWTLSKSMAV